MTDTVPVVVAPDPIAAGRSYLLSRDEITTEQVSDEMPDEAEDPRWPAIRLTDLITVTLAPGFYRAFLQLDCWAETQKDADRLGRTVAGVLGALRDHTTADALITSALNVAFRSQPDTALTPVQPRSIVTCHLCLQPRGAPPP